MGLSTVIGKSDKDASGRGLDTAMRATMERLRTWDFRTQAHTPTDRNLRHAFSQLDILKDKLGLPDAATEKTAYIYRKAQERGMVRGRTISGVLQLPHTLPVEKREFPEPYQTSQMSATSSARNWLEHIDCLFLNLI